MPVDTVDASSVAYLNGLVILNSAFFAIAQYIDKRQADKIKELQDIVRPYDLEGNNVYVKKVKILWEDITNEKPHTTYSLIVSYMMAYVLYAFTHMLIQIGYICSYWLVALSICLFISSIWLSVQFILMHTQLKKVKEKTESFTLQHTAWQEACAEAGTK